MLRNPLLRSLTSNRCRLLFRNASTDGTSKTDSTAAPTKPQFSGTTSSLSASPLRVLKTRPPSIDAYSTPKPDNSFFGKYGGGLAFGAFFSAGLLLWYSVQYQDIYGRSDKDREHAFDSLQRTLGFFVPSVRLAGEEDLSFTEGIKRAAGRTPEALKELGQKRKEALDADRERQLASKLPSTTAQLHYAAQKSMDLEREEQRARALEYRTQLKRQAAELQAKRSADAHSAPT